MARCIHKKLKTAFLFPKRRSNKRHECSSFSSSSSSPSSSSFLCLLLLNFMPYWQRSDNNNQEYESPLLNVFCDVFRDVFWDSEICKTQARFLIAGYAGAKNDNNDTWKNCITCVHLCTLLHWRVPLFGRAAKSCHCFVEHEIGGSLCPKESDESLQPGHFVQCVAKPINWI